MSANPFDSSTAVLVDLDEARREHLLGTPEVELQAGEPVLGLLELVLRRVQLAPLRVE
jgi:hypothetical protein